MSVRTIGLLSVSGALLLAATAGRAWMPNPNLRNLEQEVESVNPGPETQALAPLIGTFAIAGSIPARTLAENQPEMRSRGSHSCRWIVGGLFVECDISDTARSGKTAITWSGRVTIGWDYQAKAYRGVVVDRQGTLGMLEGPMRDQVLSLALISTNTLGGQPFKYRLTFDMKDPKSIQFTSEVQQGEKWVKTEIKKLTPARKPG